MKTISIEGWRGINHSYAMVNQWQLLEMARRDLHLRHVDVPYAMTRWNRQNNASGLTQEQMRVIDSIQAPAHGEHIDICYRIAFPVNLSHSNVEKIFVFGTSEAQATQNTFVNRDPKSANKRARNLSVITPSRWSKVGFINAGFDEDRVKVVPHGIDPQTFFPLDTETRLNCRKAMGIQPEHFVLLSLGAFTWNKGGDLLVVAYSILKKKYPNLKLVLKDQSNLYAIKGQDVVAGLEKTDMRKHLNEEALKDIIYISRNLNLDELRQIYGSSDCYVSPYRAEGFNIPPLEAAACGTPVIVTTGGSTDDYFHPSIGSQVEAAIQAKAPETFLEPNLESLVTQLTEMVEGAKSLGGPKGSQYVHENFSWSRVCDRLLGVMGVTE